MHYTYYKTRFFVLSWSITKIILRCTVSKTLKKIHAGIFMLLSVVETWQTDPGNVEYYSATSHL